MVKHIVMFKLNDELIDEKKMEVAMIFKQAIEALPEKIDCIRSIYVGININAAEKWDICLESSFDSLEDVKTYSTHPEHIKAAQTIKAYKADRACCDFEI